ncbi:MAG: hypothetical protein KF744_11150 [Taibaiella sp.]|nr:hypothetical protein [Taibaiella sp.]
MTLSKVIGQTTAKAGILQMWKNNTFPHALLITGAEGTGGLPLAIAVAQYVFCENRTETDSCGICAGCSKAARLEHADLHLSFPTISPKPNTKPHSKWYMQEFREFVRQSPYGTTFDWLQFINAENKQGNITADECRDIIEAMYLKSYEGGYKVLIMWRPEYLKNEGNILLKLIEEPPKDTIMILVAEKREQVIATILSRTQEVRLVPLSAVEISAALTERNGTEPNLATQVAHMASGSYTEALRLLRENENDLFPHLRQMFNLIFRNNGPGIAAFAEGWSKNGREQQKNFLQYVLQMMEHALKAQFARGLTLPLAPEEAEFVGKLAEMKLTTEKYVQLTKRLSDAIYYIERNAHGRTQFHALLIEMRYIVSGVETTI